MAHLDTVKTESELPPSSSAKEKPLSLWGMIFRILWIAVFVVVIAVSSQIIYDYTRYDNFWVSGDSMYPTLNKDATSSLHPGEANYGTWGNFSGRAGLDVTYVCDYGLSDSKPGFQETLQRFDIVVAHYDSTYNPEHTGDDDMFREDAVIKRLIGLPGESLYFTPEGELYVKKVGSPDYALVEQPSAIVNDVDEHGNRVIGNTASITAIKNIGTSVFVGSVANPATMQADEYFVMGDNRRLGASDDSRKYGPLGIRHRSNPSYPLGKDLLGGKAVAVTAKRTVIVKSNGTIVNHWLFGSTLLPWQIKYLGPDGEAANTLSVTPASLSNLALFSYAGRRLWR